MDNAKVLGRPEEMCGGSLQQTGMPFRGNNNTSRSEAGTALTVYA